MGEKTLSHKTHIFIVILVFMASFGLSGLAPFHDFEDKISTELKNRLDEIWQGLMDGSIQAR